MNLTCFCIDYNNQQCSASFGLPFEFKGHLVNLPREKDGKPVKVVGLTPYTVEKVINVPWERRAEADNITNWYYYDVPRMIEKLEALSAEPHSPVNNQ